ncbi:MAG: Fic family protein [Elusimicrobia bacterium]|nr:Fic family protein [Elusimicrobiota bacterium]
MNYASALRWIWKYSPTDIKEKDLLKLHNILTVGLLSKDEVGSYKTKPNAVFGNGKIIYKPPPPEAAAPLTRALLGWIHSAGEEHPIIIAAVAHHRLVSIHPFMDGNGRIARALESWLLFRRGFDTHHILALDEFFDHDRSRYYREIQNVREQEDDLTSWLEYVAEGINETLRKAQSRIQSLRVKGGTEKITLIPKQERILQILSQVPRIRGGELAKSLSVTRSHLSKMIRPMIQAGLVVKEGSTRSAAYRLP